MNIEPLEEDHDGRTATIAESLSGNQAVKLRRCGEGCGSSTHDRPFAWIRIVIKVKAQVNRSSGHCRSDLIHSCDRSAEGLETIPSPFAARAGTELTLIGFAIQYGYIGSNGLVLSVDHDPQLEVVDGIVIMLGDSLLEFGERLILQYPESGKLRRRDVFLIERGQVESLVFAERLVRDNLIATAPVSSIRRESSDDNSLLL